jgi:hypothetical protein
MSTPVEHLALRLTALAIKAGALELSYAVRNESEHRMFLVNRLLRREPDGLRPDPDLVYAHVRPGPALALSKQLIAIPDDIDVEVPEVPCLTPLEAGEEFAETVTVPVPVSAYDPYDPQPSGDSLAIVEQVIWTLGYVVEASPLPVSEQELATGGLAWRMDYGPLILEQRTESVTADGVEVPTTIDLDAAGTK